MLSLYYSIARKPLKLGTSSELSPLKAEGEKMDEAIDMVLPWVDSNDPTWQADKRKYQSFLNEGEELKNCRYRDWDNLKYVFRSIEVCVPWIRRIHFITCNQVPGWMNLDNPKLHIVNHSDYIPTEYLPTFSSHTIELNMHRIQGLSEKFIYSNDDVFFLQKTQPDIFFQRGLPCDLNVSTALVPSQISFSSVLFNNVSYINKHFFKKESIKSNFWKFINYRYGIRAFISFFVFLRWGNYTGFFNHHLAQPYLKSTFNTVWEKEPEILHETSKHKFRNYHNDVNQYIFRYWQLASGNFYPSALHGKCYTISLDNRRLLEYIYKRRGQMICINDEGHEKDFEKAKNEINHALNTLYPKKCSFER